MSRIDAPATTALVTTRSHQNFWLGVLVMTASLGMFSQNISAQDCSNMPGNLVANCGFDTELTPWTELFGDYAHDPVEGYLAPGSVLVSGGPTGNGFEVVLRQCLPTVRTQVDYTFFGAIRGQEPIPDSCELFMATSSMPACSGGGSFVTVPLVPQLDTWLVFPDGELSTTSTTQSVRFEVRCVDAEENFSFHFDDAYFGIPPLHYDGFENLESR